jgi:Domain of unknown function (DUF4861)
MLSMIKIRLLSLGVLVCLPGLCFAAAGPLTVKAVNKLPLARSSETIELSAKDLAPLGSDLEAIHVRDAAGKEMICQAVDTDYDAYHKPDLVIFQADFAPSEAKNFTVTVGKKHEYAKDDYKAFGRFVRERFDDFAWENDRIAHRTYGKALETWDGEPLSSSTIDIWSKRTPHLVINDWYLTDNYHADAGTGADFYSAGASRGDGGGGLWADDRLWVSRNFVQSRALANGPIRVMFELGYEPYNVNGTSVAEVKRVTLDAGRHFDHYQSTYQPFVRPGQSVSLTPAAGLKKVSGEQKELNAEHGWLAKWEPMEKNSGNQGLAILVDPKNFEKQTEDKLNLLVLMKPARNNEASWWAGFCWDKAGPFATPEAWKKHVDEFAQRLSSPIEVSVLAP